MHTTQVYTQTDANKRTYTNAHVRCTLYIDIMIFQAARNTVFRFGNLVRNCLIYVYVFESLGASTDVKIAKFFGGIPIITTVTTTTTCTTWTSEITVDNLFRNNNNNYHSIDHNNWNNDDNSLQNYNSL